MSAKQAIYYFKYIIVMILSTIVSSRTSQNMAPRVVRALELFLSHRPWLYVHACTQKHKSYAFDVY